ncbi:MAG: CBS domain-containing protein [Candidatus Omnitrophica bacterium]|nr:CBS domain-containing protein [Candidatus Omnitrophota bacterium]
MKSRIKDIMTTDIKFISADMNAKEGLRMLIKTGMSGLPIVDSNKVLVGVFTEREVLNAILPAYVKNVGTFVYVEDSKAELKKMAALENISVKDIMRKEVPTILEDATLTEASRIMLTKSERRVIVVDKDKHPIGVITRCDVVRALSQEAGITE